MREDVRLYEERSIAPSRFANNAFIRAISDRLRVINTRAWLTRRLKRVQRRNSRGYIRTCFCMCVYAYAYKMHENKRRAHWKISRFNIDDFISDDLIERTRSLSPESEVTIYAAADRSRFRMRAVHSHSRGLCTVIYDIDYGNGAPDREVYVRTYVRSNAMKLVSAFDRYYFRRGAK